LVSPNNKHENWKHVEPIICDYQALLSMDRRQLLAELADTYDAIVRTRHQLNLVNSVISEEQAAFLEQARVAIMSGQTTKAPTVTMLREEMRLNSRLLLRDQATLRANLEALELQADMIKILLGGENGGEVDTESD
jgi:hypothetical protein